MTEYIVDLAAHNAGAAMALCDGVHDEIVRCRDCEFASAGEAVISGDWKIGSCCNSRFRGSIHHANVTANGFCAWGERRNDGQL